MWIVVILIIATYACFASIGGPVRQNPPNLAEFLDFSLHRQKRAREPVFVPKAVEFKLQTTTGFS